MYGSASYKGNTCAYAVKYKEKTKFVHKLL